MQAMQETGVWSPGWEDPLEEEMAIHPSILAWKIPWTEDPGGGYSRCGHRELDMTEHKLAGFFIYLQVLGIIF